MNRATDLSAAAFDRRARDFPKTPSPIARNYAAARLNDGTVVTGRSRGPRLHAEIDLLHQIASMPGPPGIVEIYTERQPCCVCEHALEEAGVPGDSIAYSVEFFDTLDFKTAADMAELALLNGAEFETLRRMVREAEGPRERPAGLARLVEAVAEPLREAGLPVLLEPDLGAEPGVEVVVDDLDDDAGGVSVSWYVGAELSDRVFGAVQTDHMDDPALAEAAAMKQHRLVELSAILAEAGFATVEIEDGTAPYHLSLAAQD
ncbi:MAG TPA: nucleic acid/nucleotide deaminase domain-containing protein [Glycomyces sp.]|nr:nucleic acid/nucleotide deaminase domain-containing protein [Glycomyces sp.]